MVELLSASSIARYTVPSPICLFVLSPNHEKESPNPEGRARHLQEDSQEIRIRLDVGGGRGVRLLEASSEEDSGSVTAKVKVSCFSLYRVPCMVAPDFLLIFKLETYSRAESAKKTISDA